jgi:diphosphomevalonate decarboxylase
MASIIDLMRKKAERKNHLKILSRNHGILSGSSDSGAAALVLSLNDFLGLNFPLSDLHSIARHGSETAYRSLYGGLSEYYFSRHAPHARCLLHAEELRDIAIYAIPFNYPRYNADVLHMNVVGHPHYKKRVLDVEKRIHDFKSSLVERDFSRCLKLMEDDARQVHGMFEYLDLTVRKEKMLELCHKVEQWRDDGIECYWNVAGASVVYVFTLRKHKRKLLDKLAEYKPIEYKIAGPARVL